MAGSVSVGWREAEQILTVSFMMLSVKHLVRLSKQPELSDTCLTLGCLQRLEQYCILLLSLLILFVTVSYLSKLILALLFFFFFFVM